jgi:hypothetical protein
VENWKFWLFFQNVGAYAALKKSSKHEIG